jgi:hypothetical protein
MIFVRKYIDKRIERIFYAHGEKIMAFRADEAEVEGRDHAITKLISKLPPEKRRECLEKLDDVIERYGPVVDGYPTWHPFVWGVKNPLQRPDAEHGYEDLDHVVHLKDAFISCPYSDGTKLVRAINKMDPGPSATLEAETLDFALYNESVTPVLVTCKWSEAYRLGDRTTPQRIAIGRMLESELKFWQRAEVAETWETMRPYFLGTPHGSRSSLFVSETTGSAMKRVWQAIIGAGVYGPIMVVR